MSPRKKWIAITVFFALAGWVTLKTRGQYCLPIFQGAGSDALSGIDPYVRREGRPDLFKYAPIWAILLIPSLWLGPAPWYCLNVAAFWHACRTWKGEMLDWKEIALLTPLILANGFYGQINGLLLWLIVMGMRGSGLGLALAAWMKLFPAYLLVFSPNKAGTLRRFWPGVGAAIILGFVLPWIFWQELSLQVFVSWIQSLRADMAHPHHKLGLLAWLVQSGIDLETAKLIQSVSAALFFAALAAIAFFARSASAPVLQSAAITGFLFFSHMTEPPTLALLAPAVLTLQRTHPRMFLPLLLLIVILPSDVTPDALKSALGGQYALKTLALAFCLALLSRQIVTQRA